MRMRLPVLSFLLGVCAIGSDRSAAPADSHNDPPSLLQFEDQSMLSRCDPIPAPTEKQAAFLIAGPGFALHRKDQLSLPVKELSSLTVRPKSASVWISGTQADVYSVDLCASAGKPGGANAQDLLDAIQLSRRGDTLSVAGPEKYDQERPSQAELRISAPRELPVTVDGTYSSVKVKDIAAPVTIRTTNARVLILRTSGRVNAEANEYGVIDFAGDRGEVRLSAASEINLKFTAQAFDGTLSATAKQDVRVILPDGFSTPFQVEVRKASDFLCRAQLCNQLKRVLGKKTNVFQFGPGNPTLSFASPGGRVIIDSLQQLEQAESDRRREADERRAEYARNATKINDLAGSIQTEADARQYVDLLFQSFAPNVPGWTSSVLDRVAQGEYAAAARAQFVSEEQIVNAFNNFQQQLGAPAWAYVSPEELHNLRDGQLASAKSLWKLGERNLWSMPNIYHVDSAGKLASGCRPVEALKLLYGLHSSSGNIIYARQREEKNLLASALSEQPPATQQALQERIVETQLRLAKAQEYDQQLRQLRDAYIRRRGNSAYQKLVRAMFESVLP